MEHLLPNISKFLIIEDPSVELISMTEESFNNLLKNILRELFTVISGNYTILDEQGNPFKPTKTKKQISLKTYCESTQQNKMWSYLWFNLGK